MGADDEKKETYDLSEHVKLSQYQIIRNTVDYYTISASLRVVQEKDCTKIHWMAEPNDVDIKIDGRNLLFITKGQEFGAFMKLPKNADVAQDLDIDLPPKGGCFITLQKVGSKEKAPPLEDRFTGRGPQVIMQNGKVVSGKFEDMVAKA